MFLSFVLPSTSRPVLNSCNPNQPSPLIFVADQRWGPTWEPKSRC